MKRMLLQQKQHQQPSSQQQRLSSTLILAILIVVCTTTTNSSFLRVDAFTTTTSPAHNTRFQQQPQVAKIDTTKKNPFSLISTTTTADKSTLFRRPNRVSTSLSFKDDKYDNGYEEEENQTILKQQDWNAITTTAGNLIQTVGTQVVHFAGWFVSKLLDILSENVNKIKDKIISTTSSTEAPESSSSSSTASARSVNTKSHIMELDENDEDDKSNDGYYTRLVEETAIQDDESLFRSIFGMDNNNNKQKKGGSKNTTTSRNKNNDDDASNNNNYHSLIDRVLHQAISLLEQDPMSTYLLGTIGTTTSSSLRYNQPISQRSEINTTSDDNNNGNGKKTTTRRTIHARFEVFGNYGRKGIASVMSNDNKIVSLDLEIDGRMHRVKTTTTTPPKSSFRSTSSSSTSQSTTRSPKVQVVENKRNNEDTAKHVDVEIMKGVYWPTVASLQDENIIDAEIEDKEFF